MLFHRDPILVSLSPTGLRVGVVVGGEVARVERVVLEPDDFEQHWKQALRPLDDALRKAVAAVGVRPGAPVICAYHGPHSVAEMFHAPAVGKAASQCAELYLKQSLPGEGRGWVTGHWSLYEDQTKPTTEAAKPTVRTLVLVAADVGADLDLLAAWMARSGLALSGAMPARAALLRTIVREMSSNAKSKEGDGASPRVRVHLGEHTLAIAGWADGHLAIARCADVGYALLSDAIFRSGRSAQTSDVLTREYATRLLFAAGVPRRGEMLDPAIQLKADAVLPLLNPALQRLVIEVRNTLRFGLTDSSLSGLKLALEGPGASIPGLGEILSELLELAVDVPERDVRSGGGGIAEDQVGNLAIVRSLGASHATLVPQLVRVRHVSQRMKLATTGGGMLGALAVGSLLAMPLAAERRIDRRAAEIEQDANRLDEINQLKRDVQSRAFEFNSADRVVRAALGERPEWAAVLASLSQIAMPGVTIAEIAADYEGQGAASPTLMIRGRASLVAAAMAAGRDAGAGASGEGGMIDPIPSLRDAIRRLVVVSEVDVVSSRVMGEGADMSREFVLRVLLRGEPARVPELSDQERRLHTASANPAEGDAP